MANNGSKLSVKSVVSIAMECAARHQQPEHWRIHPFVQHPVTPPQVNL
jgi:hypothetical protein